MNWPQATLRNFHFKNIHMAGEAGKSFLRASADGITFDNIRVAGRTATNAADLNLAIEGEAKNISYMEKP